MRIIKDNALTLAMLGLFLLCFAGQSLAGWGVENEQRELHGQSRVEWTTYLKSGDFWEATGENWESEFLQMAAFVFLSACLVQRGSAESKKPTDEAVKENEQKAEERPKGLRPTSEGERSSEVPWPVRKGGLFLAIYSHSLSLALALLFVGSFAIHAIAGHAAESTDLVNHGQPPISLWEFMGSSTFWFQSLQNWQSEFLSVGLLVVLTIFLRERGSPQSKPVEAPHRMTGPS
jgi:hypothetical protein